MHSWQDAYGVGGAAAVVWHVAAVVMYGSAACTPAHRPTSSAQKSLASLLSHACAALHAPWGTRLQQQPCSLREQHYGHGPEDAPMFQLNTLRVQTWIRFFLSLQEPASTQAQQWRCCCKQASAVAAAAGARSSCRQLPEQCKLCMDHLICSERHLPSCCHASWLTWLCMSACVQAWTRCSRIFVMPALHCIMCGKLPLWPPG